MVALRPPQGQKKHDDSVPIRSIIIEMTECEAKSHQLLDCEETRVPSKKASLNAFFSVTAKHFSKTISETA